VILNRLASLIEKHRLGKEVLTDTSEQTPVSWEYRFSEPAADWATTTGGEGWLTGFAPFGSMRSPNTALKLGKQELWLRRSFELSELPQGPVKLRVNVDDTARVMLNGVELAYPQEIKTANDLSSGCLEIDCTDEAASAIRTGTNVLAVHYENTANRSLIDAGLHVVKEDLWGEILDQSIEQNPENLQLVETRAKRYIQEERYLEAAHDYVRFASISRKRPGIHALDTASLFALSGDLKAYQDYCKSQLERLENLDEKNFPENVTKASLLLDGAISNDELPLAAVQQRLNSFSANDQMYGWFQGTLALAAIRSGKFEEADSRFEQVERNINVMPPGVTGLIHALRARVLYEEDKELNPEQIDAALQRSMQAIEEQEVIWHPDGTLVGSSLLDGDGNPKHNAPIAELLRREVKQKMTELKSR
jgi:tetratricopeptide (TPR) repeat protein